MKESELTKFQHTTSAMNVRRDIVRVSSSGLNAYCPEWQAIHGRPSHPEDLSDIRLAGMCR
jgi:hypothetical protein